MPEFLNRLRNCRLCWTLTRYVFLLILVIESVILLPSAYNFRANTLIVLERTAMSAVRAAGRIDTAHFDQRILAERLVGLHGLSGIVGAGIAINDGTVRMLFGETPFDEAVSPATIIRKPGTITRSSAADGARRDIAWTDAPAGGLVTFMVRIDSSGVNAELAAFILRIAGLVAILVVFVTVGTMFLMDRFVLAPIIRLRDSMLGAGADPDNATRYRVELAARDELADVLFAHNALLQDMADSKRLDRANAEERARFLVRHDPLTGLPNRDYFLETLRHALEHRNSGHAMVHAFVLNFSGFSAINDALGQHVGDQTLIHVGKTLSELVRQQRFVARIGGDEFAIIDQSSDGPTPAALLAERILGVVEKPLVLEGKIIRLRSRLGIACAQAENDTVPEQLLHDAQVALNLIRADNDAKVRYRFYSAEMMQAVVHRQDTERELVEALRSGQLHLFYQPKIVVAESGMGVGVSSCEALIRWKHPSRGWVSPGEFIPVAESSELIFEIGEWVLQEACAQVGRWRDAGLVPPRVAVNIAARQFQDVALPDLVYQTVTRAGIEPDALELEITETAAMSNVTLSINVISSLRKIGVRLSIDDFGTGYSSLSYLRQFEVDSIKIDKSFIDDVTEDRNAASVCDAIIRLGHSLGKKIIAEGVETEAQLEFLRRRQCDEAQGFLFARPMPAEDLTKILERSLAA